MEQNKSEARNNIRLAVRTSLLFDTFPEYVKWACCYMWQSDVTSVTGLLWDKIRDISTVLRGWQPWDTNGRRVDVCQAIQSIFIAIDHYHQEDWQNASNYAGEAIDKLGEIHRYIGTQLAEATQLIGKSLTDENSVWR